ncbi:hypothetical protein VVT58_01900 [Sphingobium sp. SJ10-10]|uniref:hypothetical protein n=1 Tax=Sphingobium sp. SJ10-10 TaxID=3114999 RepID=UPI002E1980D0|nr:hypothetical protein [Sphingobium sp. SJ10-10]
MTPANTPEEQAVFCHFDDAHSARAYADELLLVWGDIFGSVVDLTRGGVEL